MDEEPTRTEGNKPKEGSPPETPEATFDRLNREFNELFTEYISTKWTDFLCPVCKIGPWASRNPISVPLWIGVDRIFIYVPVVCQTCGHTVFFDALQMGLVDSQGRVKKRIPEASPEDSEEPEV
jgi:hypothetical protein